MRRKKKHVRNTRENLLTTASNVFSNKGYRYATVAEICNRAGANIAAVNYHFGSKKALYIETWRHCFSKSIETHPLDGGVDSNAQPEERLRGYLEAFLALAADEDNRMFWIEQ